MLIRANSAIWFCIELRVTVVQEYRSENNDFLPSTSVPVRKEQGNMNLSSKSSSTKS